MIRFELGSKYITSYTKPFTVTFQTNNNTGQVLRLIESFPKKKFHGNPRNNAEENFEKLTIHRIDVFKNTGYIVEFFNFTGADSYDVNSKYDIKMDGFYQCYFQVYTSYFEKPSYETFQEKKTTVSSSKTKLRIEHNENFNVWYYLSILKNENTVTTHVTVGVQLIILLFFSETGI